MLASEAGYRTVGLCCPQKRKTSILSTSHLCWWWLSCQGTGIRQPAQREQCHVPQKSAGGWRKDEARTMVWVSAWGFLQCFDTDGWGTLRPYGM